ncbi:MAG: antitoxin [Aeromicrobium sp.]
MGFLDKLKGKSGLKDKAIDLAKQHDDKLDQGIDKASDLADKATKGKYTDKIDNAAEKAKDAYEKPQDTPPAQDPRP